MLKRLGTLLLIFIIVTVSSTGVFAGNPEGESIVSNTTGSGITGKSTVTSRSAIIAQREDFDILLDKALKNVEAINDEELIMTITSPEYKNNKDSTYKKSYVLSGYSQYSDVVVEIRKYNDETDEYELMYNTDDESSWEIGDFQLFSKEIILTKGINKIKIVSYRSSDKEKARMEDNIQVNCFTIELLSESIIKKFINMTTDIGSVIKDGVSNLFMK